MLSITRLNQEAKAMQAEGDKHYKVSQEERMRAILKYKESGDRLRLIHDMVKPATALKPVVMEGRTYTGWEDFLKQNDWSKSTANDYVYLSKHWHIVIKLGMQDASTFENSKRSLRLCRTIKVIRWYLAELDKGRPEAELTYETYWKEQEALLARAAAMLERQQTTTTSSTTGEVQPTWKDLKRMLNETQAQLEAKEEEVERLRSQMTELRSYANKVQALQDEVVRLRKELLFQRQPVSV